MKRISIITASFIVSTSIQVSGQVSGAESYSCDSEIKSPEQLCMMMPAEASAAGVQAPRIASRAPSMLTREETRGGALGVDDLLIADTALGDATKLYMSQRPAKPVPFAEAEEVREQMRLIELRLTSGPSSTLDPRVGATGKK